MHEQKKEILTSFMCETKRRAEELFAQALSEDDTVRLFFIHENQAFTDGQNIIVDPADGELFTDKDALKKTQAYLGWAQGTLSDPWHALHIITRAQTIHECLHLLYSDFPTPILKDTSINTENKRAAAGLISNIIEDAFIEAVGCSRYDNMAFYLQFGRISHLFRNAPQEGTVTRTMREIRLLPDTSTAPTTVSQEQPDPQVLCDYLDYMVTFLLYPMVVQEEPDASFAPYVQQTKPLFLAGSTAPSPAERYTYARQIFDVILPLIPESEKLDLTKAQRRLSGSKTHSAESSTVCSANRRGRTQSVTRRLFTDADGNTVDDTSNLRFLASSLAEADEQRQQIERVLLYGGHTEYDGAMLGDPIEHTGITLHEYRPRIDINLRKAYQNMLSPMRAVIHAYDRQLTHLRYTQIEQREEKQLFGTGISSHRLADVKQRYWYKTQSEPDTPDLAVLLLIDGSGSMQCERRDSALRASILLHEVLLAQRIPHAIAEHRAYWEEPEMEVNILLSFDGPPEEKYNLLQLDAYDNTRDGLALAWAERYLKKHTHTQNRLLLVISDGEPCHDYDDYFPPDSIRDTATTTRTIMKHGVKVIAVALDTPGSTACYDALAPIYPYRIGCSDLTRLPSQLFGVIEKQFR